MLLRSVFIYLLKNINLRKYVLVNVNILWTKLWVVNFARVYFVRLLLESNDCKQCQLQIPCPIQIIGTKLKFSKMKTKAKISLPTAVHTHINRSSKVYVEFQLLFDPSIEFEILISGESSYFSHYPCTILGTRDVAFGRYTYKFVINFKNLCLITLFTQFTTSSSSP